MGFTFMMCVRGYDDIVSSSIRSHGRWGDCDELVTLWKLNSFSAPEIQATDSEGIFVDAGANIGACSLLMAVFGKRTYGFEPSKANMFYLTSSAMANTAQIRDKLNIFTMGIGEAHMRVPLYFAKGNAGNSQLVGNGTTIAKDHDSQVLELEDEIIVSPLDDVLWPDPAKPAPHIRVMKMDVQGYEVKILKGTRRLLKAGAIGIIKTELAAHWLGSKGSTVADLLEILKSYGYGYYRGGTVEDIDPKANYPGEVVFVRKV